MTKTATAETTVDDIYNELSLDEQDQYDDIARRGYKPVSNGKSWTAEPTQDYQDRIGPFPDLATLSEAVAKETADPIEEVNLGDGPPDEGLEHDDADLDQDDDFELTNEDSPAGKKGKTHKVKQPLLPNTEGMVLENLRQSIFEYRETTEKILELQEAQKRQSALCLALMHKFEDELTHDENGALAFQAGMLQGYIEVDVKEKFRTRKLT